MENEANDKEAENAAVNTDEQPSNVIAHNGSVPVVEAELRRQLVSEVEWKRHEEAEDEGKGDPLVSRANTEQVLGEASPCNGLTVELLDSLAGPDIGTFNVEQGLALRGRNGVHHDIAEDGTDHGAHYLHGESTYSIAPGQPTPSL